MGKKTGIKKYVGTVIKGLPLAAIVFISLLPTISTIGRQLLILFLLLWFQAYFLLDIFLAGKQ